MPSGQHEVGLGKAAAVELLFVASNADKLSALASASVDGEPGESSPAFLGRIAEKAQLSTREVRRIADAIANLQRIRSLANLDAQQTVEAVTPSVRRYSKPDDASKWEAAKDAIAGALTTLSGNNPLMVMAKAEQLAYAQQNVFVQAKVITQVRPVFNEAGDEVLQAMAIHDLVIDYFEGSIPRKIQFALDARDVADLRRACERAELKTTCLKDALKGLPWQTFAFGEPEDQAEDAAREPGHE